MSVTLGLAILLGLLLGAGAWVILVRMPFMRQPSFSDRIEPQLRAATSESRLLAQRDDAPTLFCPLERILRVVLKDTGSWLGRFDSGNKALKTRLERAGKEQTAVDFRAEQLIWAGVGLIVGVFFAFAAASNYGFNLALSLLLVLGFALLGYLARDYVLSSQIKRRESRMLEEFPALAELMALAVGAGESASGALDRVCKSSRGELSGEFAKILAQTRSGIPLADALTAFSQRITVAPLIRFTDGIIVAIERGTPLADVLRAQAQDVRDMSKRDLMEAAGRKEIGMMIPLVFGVLPITVIFAAYPGFQLLTLSLNK